MFKNVSGQKWVVFAFDETDNTAKTGDAANITANLRIDGAAADAIDDTNPVELEDGYYIFDLTQGETNGDYILICPASSTANIQVIGCPAAVFTRPPYFNVLSIESDGDLTKVNTLDGHTAQTGDNYARLGAPAGASIAADLVVIDNFVDDLESRLTAARAGYLDNLNGHNAQTGDSYAIVNNGTYGNAALQVDLDTLIKANIVLSGNASVGDTTVKITLNGGIATADYYNGQLVIITGGTGTGQARTILKYLADNTATPTRDFTVAPDNTSTFVVIGADVATLLEAGIAQAGGAATITLDATASAVNDIYVNNFIMISGGTGMGQTRLIGAYNGGTKIATTVPNWTTNPDSTSIYQILPMARVDVAGWLGNLVTGDGDLVTLFNEVNAIKAKTDNLPADPASETNVDANETKIDTIDTVVDSIKTVTDNLPNTGALTDIDTGINNIEAKLPSKDYLSGSSDADGGIDDTEAAIIQSECNDALVAQKLDHLVAVAESDDPVDNSIIAKLAASDGDWSGYDPSTDSNQSIRDRGDAAWITGGGGSITDILQVIPSIPNNIDLADTKTIRIALYLLNSLDDLPTTVEITPGTITIDRSADGGTSWTTIVNAAACTEQAGQIYYDEVFDSGTGYASGDMIRITFKGQKITVAANDYEITDSTYGWLFHTRIDSGLTGSGPSAADIADAVWDEPIADHTTGTTFGGKNQKVVPSETINDYKADVSNLDTTISSRSPESGGNIAAIKAKTDNLPADPADDSDIDSQLSTIDGKIDALNNVSSAEVQSACDSAITANTDINNIDTGVNNIEAKLPTNYIMGSSSQSDKNDEIDAIKTVTDALTSAAAAKLALSAGTIVTGQATTGTLSTTQMTTNLTETTNDHYNGRIIIWTSGVLINQATDITDYVGSSKMLTFTAVTEAPSNGDTFIII